MDEASPEKKFLYLKLKIIIIKFKKQCGKYTKIIDLLQVKTVCIGIILIDEIIVL